MATPTRTRSRPSAHGFMWPSSPSGTWSAAASPRPVVATRTGLTAATSLVPTAETPTSRSVRQTLSVCSGRTLECPPGTSPDRARPESRDGRFLGGCVAQEFGELQYAAVGAWFELLDGHDRLLAGT